MAEVGARDAAAAAGIGGGMAQAVTHNDGDGAPSSFMLLASALGRCNSCGYLRTQISGLVHSHISVTPFVKQLL